MTDATEQRPDAQSGPAVWGWLVFAAAAAAALLWVVVSSSQTSTTVGQGPGVGQRLAYLHLAPLSGGAGDVSLDDLAGRVTLLNFWGTWCPPCIREFPHLIELAEDYDQEDDFLFLPVSCGGRNDETLEELSSATEAFLAARGVDLPVYADPGAGSRRTLAALFAPEPFAYPTTVVLDRNGRIRGSWVGYSPRYVDQMRTVVAKLLAEPAD